MIENRLNWLSQGKTETSTVYEYIWFGSHHMSHSQKMLAHAKLIGDVKDIPQEFKPPREPKFDPFPHPNLRTPATELQRGLVLLGITALIFWHLSGFPPFGSRSNSNLPGAMISGVVYWKAPKGIFVGPESGFTEFHQRLERYRKGEGEGLDNDPRFNALPSGVTLVVCHTGNEQEGDKVTYNGFWSVDADSSGDFCAQPITSDQ